MRVKQKKIKKILMTIIEKKKTREKKEMMFDEFDRND